MLVAGRLRFALIIGNDRNFSLKTRNETHPLSVVAACRFTPFTPISTRTLAT